VLPASATPKQPDPRRGYIGLLQSSVKPEEAQRALQAEAEKVDAEKPDVAAAARALEE
jgi:hypothetical protein